MAGVLIGPSPGERIWCQHVTGTDCAALSRTASGLPVRSVVMVRRSRPALPEKKRDDEGMTIGARGVVATGLSTRTKLVGRPWQYSQDSKRLNRRWRCGEALDCLLAGPCADFGRYGGKGVQPKLSWFGLD